MIHKHAQTITYTDRSNARQKSLYIASSMSTRNQNDSLESGEILAFSARFNHIVYHRCQGVNNSHDHYNYLIQFIIFSSYTRLLLLLLLPLQLQLMVAIHGLHDPVEYIAVNKLIEYNYRQSNRHRKQTKRERSIKHRMRWTPAIISMLLLQLVLLITSRQFNESELSEMRKKIYRKKIYWISSKYQQNVGVLRTAWMTTPKSVYAFTNMMVYWTYELNKEDFAIFIG